jgi:hypothetical protein
MLYLVKRDVHATIRMYKKFNIQIQIWLDSYISFRKVVSLVNFLKIYSLVPSDEV